jgi:ribonuclease Z
VIRVTFLGTSAARPTVGRNVSALAIQRVGEIDLFDCGEGTQRQMMRYGTGFGVGRIFFTHVHADHYLGVIGLVRTMGLQGRTEPLVLYGPSGFRATMEQAVSLGGGGRAGFPIEMHELEAGDRVPGEGYAIEAVQVRHGTPSVGWALREDPRPGRFDLEKARALEIPEGPLFGRLQRGESVRVGDREVRPSEVVGPPRSGRLVVYTGDTAPAPEVVEAARGADLLVHDATFGDEEAARARETFHSTAREAAAVGREAGVRRLILTHISARYSANPAPLEQEAREVLPETQVAFDGMAIEIGVSQEDAP